MAQLLGDATGAAVARVWLRVDREFRPAASWPVDAPAASVLPTSEDGFPAVGEEVGDLAVDVRHQGVLLGALTVEMPANDPMDPSKARIVHDLASQAGPVVRNVGLIEELRESRRRIVAAQDDRAKKLERDIHDGAQQQLVALMVKERQAASAVDADVARARALLEQIQAETKEALEDLRDLARGIYPPLLADSGLPAALEAQARKSSLPTTVESDGIERYPQDIESAVYFSCLEALQNVAKYARASHASIRLREGGGELTFEVIDDGVGFDPASVARGTGLQGMADRIAAIGGGLEIHSSPGRGTAVTGRLPTSPQGVMSS
jgi:signal transduction histidine kinase